MTLKNLKDRYPVNTGRLHRNGGNATGDQPLGQLFKIAGKGGKLTDGLLIGPLRNCHEVAP